MVPQESLVVLLWQLIDRLPSMSSVSSVKRGRPREYSDRLFLKALVLMSIKHLHRVHELLQVLEQPTREMQTTVRTALASTLILSGLASPELGRKPAFEGAYGRLLLPRGPDRS